MEERRSLRHLVSRESSWDRVPVRLDILEGAGGKGWDVINKFYAEFNQGSGKFQIHHSSVWRSKVFAEMECLSKERGLSGAGGREEISKALATHSEVEVKIARESEVLTSWDRV